MGTLQKQCEFSWTGEKVEGPGVIDWGIAEQANGLMAILVNAPGGVLTGQQVRALAEAAGDTGLLKNTRRMSPTLLVPRDQVGEALTKLQEAGLRVASLHRSVRNIVACPGKGFSKNSITWF